MAKLSAADRRALPKSSFLVPSKAPGPGSYPVPDAAHRRAAVGLAGMHHGKSGASAIRSKLHAKGFSSMGQKSSE
jgi:hypothetical protein